MLRNRRAWLALLVCAPLWVAGPAGAQQGAPPDATVDDEARQLFTEGLEFVEQEDWVQAEERFRRVLALRSSQVVAYNLASALVRLGRPAEAAELLRSILRAPDVDTATRDAAQQLLLETEPQIGTLTIRVSGDMAGVRFSLDEKPIELTTQVQTISVDPGEHTLTAHRAATPLAFERVTVGGGSPLQAELAIELPAQVMPKRAAHVSRPAVHAAPEAATAPAPPPRDEPESSGSSFWLWAGGGAAVAAAAAVLTVVLVVEREADPVMGDTDPPFVRGRVQ